MATIRKRGERWQAQVRLQGHAPLAKTFRHKSDAEAWARQQEVAIERGEIQSARRSLRAYVLSDLLARYESEVTPCKRGAASELYRIKTLKAASIASLPLDKVTSNTLALYRDQRLLEVSGPSVRRELAILQHCLEVARKEWGVPLVHNPVEAVSKPQSAKSRTRRLTSEDAQKLAHGLQKTRNRLLADIVRFAIVTGMRRGELLSLSWANVDMNARTAHLPDTKNGESRTVPLSPNALSVLTRQKRFDGEDSVFPMTGNAVRLAWERLKKRAGVEDLRFHDLRHEAISRFFELGLSVPEVSAISGHKDTRMLMRYTHLKPENIAQKLREAGAPEQHARGTL
ncbi:MAG: site-specific integrase [Beijerinckiaceae bacterium]|nr:MAG: site-specific integrase [Beijerinckiaceae bacterium]